MENSWKRIPDDKEEIGKSRKYCWNESKREIEWLREIMGIAKLWGVREQERTESQHNKYLRWINEVNGEVFSYSQFYKSQKK